MTTVEEATEILKVHKECQELRNALQSGIISDVAVYGTSDVCNFLNISTDELDKQIREDIEDKLAEKLKILEEHLESLTS